MWKVHSGFEKYYFPFSTTNQVNLSTFSIWFEINELLDKGVIIWMCLSSFKKSKGSLLNIKFAVIVL